MAEPKPQQVECQVDALSLVEEEEEDEEEEDGKAANGCGITPTESESTCADSNSCLYDGVERFKAPLLPTKKSTTRIHADGKTNGHLPTSGVRSSLATQNTTPTSCEGSKSPVPANATTSTATQAIDQTAACANMNNGNQQHDGGGGDDELLGPFVSIGKHCYLCPHARQYIATTYPALPAKSTAANGKNDGNEFIKEIVMDEFSLLLFQSTDDYKIFKEQEDALRERERAERKKRLYEENLHLGKAKKKGRKSKGDIERARRETRKRDKLERREQRLQRHAQRRVERRVAELELTPEERVIRKAARQKAREKRREEKRQLRVESQLEDERRLKGRVDSHHREWEKGPVDDSSSALFAASGDRHLKENCATRAAASYMAIGGIALSPSTSSPLYAPVDKFNQKHLTSSEKPTASHEDQTSSSSSSVIRCLSEQASVKGMKRSTSSIGIAGSSNGSTPTLQPGGNGADAEAVAEFLSPMYKTRKIDSVQPALATGSSMIGIAQHQQHPLGVFAGERKPLTMKGQPASNTPIIAMPPPVGPARQAARDNSLPVGGIPDGLTSNQLLLLNQSLLGQPLLAPYGNASLPAIVPLQSASTSKLVPQPGGPDALLPSLLAAISANNFLGRGGGGNALPQLLQPPQQLLLQQLLIAEQQMQRHKLQQQQEQLARPPPAASTSVLLAGGQLAQSSPQLGQINLQPRGDSATLNTKQQTAAFPTGAALASQLAGAAVFGGTNASHAPSAASHLAFKTRSSRCDMHVRIAHRIASHMELKAQGDAGRHVGSLSSTTSTSASALIANQTTSAASSSGLSQMLNATGTQTNVAGLQALVDAGLLPASLLPSALATVSQPPLPLLLPQKEGPTAQQRPPTQKRPIPPASASTLDPTAMGLLPMQQQQQLATSSHHAFGDGKLIAAAGSMLGLPIMPINHGGASGSLTKGTSSTAAAAQHSQQLPDIASRAAGVFPHPLGGSAAFGGGDMQAAIAQLLLSQLAATGPAVPASPFPPVPSSLSGVVVPPFPAPGMIGGSGSGYPVNCGASTQLHNLPLTATPTVCIPPVATHLQPAVGAISQPWTPNVPSIADLQAAILRGMQSIPNAQQQAHIANTMANTVKASTAMVSNNLRTAGVQGLTPSSQMKPNVGSHLLSGQLSSSTPMPTGRPVMSTAMQHPLRDLAQPKNAESSFPLPILPEASQTPKKKSLGQSNFLFQNASSADPTLGPIEHDFMLQQHLLKMFNENATASGTSATSLCAKMLPNTSAAAILSSLSLPNVPTTTGSKLQPEMTLAVGRDVMGVNPTPSQAPAAIYNSVAMDVLGQPAANRGSTANEESGKS